MKDTFTGSKLYSQATRLHANAANSWFKREFPQYVEIVFTGFFFLSNIGPWTRWQQHSFDGLLLAPLT